MVKRMWTVFGLLILQPSAFSFGGIGDKKNCRTLGLSFVTHTNINSTNGQPFHETHNKCEHKCASLQKDLIFHMSDDRYKDPCMRESGICALEHFGKIVASVLDKAVVSKHVGTSLPGNTTVHQRPSKWIHTCRCQALIEYLRIDRKTRQGQSCQTEDVIGRHKQVNASVSQVWDLTPYNDKTSVVFNPSTHCENQLWAKHCDRQGACWKEKPTFHKKKEHEDAWITYWKPVTAPNQGKWDTAQLCDPGNEYVGAPVC